MTRHARSACSTWLAVVGAGILAAAPACDGPDAGSDEPASLIAASASPDIVISQLYGGGGNSGAQFTHDYVELFNRGVSSVTITGWSVQYASASGSSWAKANLSGTIPAGGYYLVQLAAGSGTSANLPSPDATGTMNMSGTSGKVALVTNQTLLACGGGTGTCVPGASVRDFVGYGTADQFEGRAAPTLSNTTAGFRAAGGCTDSDNNATDLAPAAPAPRNSSSTRHSCGGGAVDAGVVDSGAGSPDAGVGSPDAGVGTPDAGGGGSGDGTPTRHPCTGTFGSQLNTTFGRLDGFLVAVVPINGSSTCRGDNNHVHLQIQVGGQVEDIAVNTSSTSGNPNVDFRTVNAPLKGIAWTEGWHPSQQLDYVNNLGVTSGSFTETPQSTLAPELASLLSNANHVSIFTTGFDGTGGHLIHRNPTNHDGAIVINPLSSSPTYLVFHFSTQSF